MIWLYWLGGALSAFLYNSHLQKQAALQSIDAALLLVNSSAGPQAAKVTADKQTTIQTNFGAIQSDQGVDQNYISQVQALSPATPATQWLVLATAVQSAGYPVLSQSLSVLGMHLIEGGQIGV